MFTIFILVVTGILLMTMEVFVPGGILGLIGGVLAVLGIYYSFSGYGMVFGMAILLISVVVLGVLIVMAFKLIPHTRAGQWFILGEEVSKAKGVHSDSYTGSNLVGKEGVTESLLRPAGIAQIEGQRVDVMTEGEYVEPSTRIRVIRVDGNRVVVDVIR